MHELNLALGALPFGTSIDEAASFAILDRYVDLGGTIIDTANNYSFWMPGAHGGESETVLGRWFAARPGARDRVTLSTKVGAQPTVPGTGLETGEGLSAAAITAAIEASLRRLRVEHVDTYWAHVEDRTVPLGETLAAFHTLVENGTVGEIGASNHATWRVERANAIARDNGLTPFTLLQLRHSYLQPRPGVVIPEGGHTLATPETFDYIRNHPGMRLWAYTSLLFGAYTRADKPLPEHYEHPGTTRRLTALDTVAAQVGATRNQIVLAWQMGGDPAITPLVGVTTIAQLDEIVAAGKITLTADQRTLLDQAA